MYNILIAESCGNINLKKERRNKREEKYDKN